MLYTGWEIWENIISQLINQVDSKNDSQSAHWEFALKEESRMIIKIKTFSKYCSKHLEEWKQIYVV